MQKRRSIYSADFLGSIREQGCESARFAPHLPWASSKTALRTFASQGPSPQIVALASRCRVPSNGTVYIATGARAFPLRNSAHAFVIAVYATWILRLASLPTGLRTVRAHLHSSERGSQFLERDTLNRDAVASTASGGESSAMKSIQNVDTASKQDYNAGTVELGIPSHTSSC
jgi:hypothetical protein